MSEAAAIAVAPQGLTGTLRVLTERLAGVGIEVAVVEDLQSCAELAARSPAAPPCILLDLRSLPEGGELEDVKVATATIRRTAAAIPHVMPVAITGAANAALIVACIRAGAGDVIDLQLEGTAAARGVVQRVFLRQVESAGHALAAARLRTMIEDLFKDLIQTERRSIDLEEKLAAAERQSGELVVADLRSPAILLVEHERSIAAVLSERLEAAGVTTFAFATGEDAMGELDPLIAGDAPIFDLALVAAQLPGIDGLETIRRLRAKIPGLPAFLMTAVHDADLAARAADLGVVGFVQKPLLDLTDVVERLSELAQDGLLRTRERLYLHRIKARHERVLARYRSLPREP